MRLTVCAAWWGTWGDGHAGAYVRRLKAAVERNLAVPHRFVLAVGGELVSVGPITLVSGGEIGGEIANVGPIDVIFLPDIGLAGELRRLWLMSEHAPLEGRVLLLDLDTLIVGNIDFLAEYRGRLAQLDDLWTPGSLPGGGIYAFHARDPALHARVWLPAARNPAQANTLSGGGDERHWFAHVMPQTDRWQRLAPGKIVSAFEPYNDNGRPARRLRESVPEGVSVVCFHGRPRMHEVADVPWVKEAWT